MYIAIDIGGTNIRVASAYSLTNPLFEEIKKIKIENNFSDDIQSITLLIKQITNDMNVDGIGISFAGPIENQKIASAPNLSDWVQKPLVETLAQTFRCEVKIENDAASAAVGEALYGLGREKDFVFLIWGSGFGGSEIKKINNTLQIVPFEPGHQIMIKDGLMCGCGQSGCLEAYIGGSNVLKYKGKRMRDLTEPEWDEALDMLATGIVNITSLRKPALIIFGGGVSFNQKERFTKLSEMISNRIKIYEAPEIAVTGFGDSAGLLGALSLLNSI